MVFSSPIFLVLFFPLVILAYYLPIKEGIRPSRKRKNIVLLISSILFYTWGEPRFVIVMMLLIVINWVLGLQIDRKPQKSKLYLIVGVVVDAGILFIYKYLSFFSENVAQLLNNKSLTVSIALPIGISFFTFQVMSYLFDVYYGKAEAQKNVLSLTLYVSFFPQLIAGPIVRYAEIEKSINCRTESKELVIEGLERFVIGLGKKVLLANYLARIADNMFEAYTNLTAGTAWLGAIAYTLQIYYDFSGYSDMAIGLGKIFGFRFNENFNYPYMADSITDFWKRWHISLSSWFRDYIYIPLGGNRVGKYKSVRNLFFVWMLTGIWHGANWTFLVWGLVYFVFLVFEKYMGLIKLPRPIRRIYTILIVIFAWVIFRADNLSMGFIYIRNMFSFGIYDKAIGLKYYLENTWFILVLALVGIFPLYGIIEKWIFNRKLLIVKYAWLSIVFYLAFIEIISESYNPFIYFNF